MGKKYGAEEHFSWLIPLAKPLPAQLSKFGYIYSNDCDSMILTDTLCS